MNIMTGDSMTKKEITTEMIIKCVDPHSMDLLFFKLIETMTHENAYEAIEEKYFSIFKCRKYKNFDSYRIAKHRRQRDSK